MMMQNYILQSALALTVLASSFLPCIAVEQGAERRILAPVEIEEYYITCNPDDFAYIYENFSEDIYIPATIVHRDRTWTNVEMRLRGDSSREFPKKSLKFKTDSEPFSNGRDVLNFNAEYLDNSFLHSVLSSRLFADINYPCFHAEPVRVYLNGVFIGMYISIENMDEAFLRAHDLNPRGNLYKATYDGACLSPGENVYTLWEKKTNEGSDRSDLEHLVAHINSVPDDEYYDFARTTFDYERMIDIIAVNMLIGNGSTYYHNYYMYRDPVTDKWTMLPWDLDRTFSAYGTGLQYNRSTSAGNADNPFLERALMCEPIMADIKNRLQELSATVFNLEHLGPVIDSMKLVLAETIAQDTSDLNESVDNWYAQLEREKEYIRYRYPALLQQITSMPGTFRITPPAARILTPPVHLRWQAASDPNGDPLTYTVRLSRQPYFPESQTQAFGNITDTGFVIESLADEGVYYWTVTVSDGQYTAEGFDKLQSFDYRRGSALQSPVTGTVVLTKENSPYIADGDIVVEAGAWLRAEPGAELRMKEAGNIVVYGGVDFNGTAEEPVTLAAVPYATHWNSMSFRNSQPSVLNNVVIRHGTNPDQSDNIGKGKIDLVNSTVTLDSVTFIQCCRGVSSLHSALTMQHCAFPAGNRGLLVDVRGGAALIEHSSFYENVYVPGGTTAEAISIDSVQGAIIRFNRISRAREHGISIRTSSAFIEGNVIDNCVYKGIDLNLNAVATLHSNVITSCLTGLGVHSASKANVDRATFYNNTYGCATNLGSLITITNSIFAQSQETDFLADHPSLSVQERYSLSDTDVLTGVGSLHGDPQFVDAEHGDFRLRASSPCIDAGDPQSEQDSDGTRADMGAYSFMKIASTPSVVINEIAYNPDTDTDTDDWVELYNPTDEPIDMSGWVFKDEDDSHEFVFPQNTLLAPYGYLVICTDTTKFRSVFPDVHPVIGNTGFGLAGGGELIRLYDNDENIIDSLTYDDNDPWPTEPDGNGPTLELISADYDNALGQSWKASKENNGTPGAKNSNTTSGVSNPTTAALYFLNQNYPNPFVDQSTIDYVLLKPASVSIEVYEVTGKPVQVLYSGELPAGKFTTSFHASGLPSGQYLYVLRVDGKIIKTRSATVVR